MTRRRPSLPGPRSPLPIRPWLVESQRKGGWVKECILQATSEAEATRHYLKLAGRWASEYELRVRAI